MRRLNSSSEIAATAGGGAGGGCCEFELGGAPELEFFTLSLARTLAVIRLKFPLLIYL